jgi:diguanylate cyclase (GGDEF)-like protein
MREETLRLYSRGWSWGLLLGALVYLVAELVRRSTELLPDWPAVLFLAVVAAAAAAFGPRGSLTSCPRLAQAPLLASLLLMPPPATLLTGLLALLFTRGRGSFGPPGTFPGGAAVTLAALALVQPLAPLLLDPLPPTGPGLLPACLLLYVLLQTAALALAALARRPGGDAQPPLLHVPGLALESVAVPPAWLLTEALRAGAWPHAALLALLLVATQALLTRLAETRAELSRSDDALASRITELDTLHSIGREILSSLELSRVFAVVERECRKIFPLDYCFLALADREGSSMQSVFRRRRGEAPQHTALALRDGLAVHVAAGKRGLRVDDLDAEPPDSPLQSGLVDGASRSALAVPLIVEERVLGVLSIQSRRPAAYDDHHLAVLTIIAQQSAVAIENARRYEEATIDSLTGFLMRDQFFRRLAEEHRRIARYGGSFSLLMIDLDGFKAINDRHGHMAGDQYLREVGDSIRAELRAADLACRYGGDEFCILLPETDDAGASSIADRIRTAVGSTIVGVDGVALRTTASVGVTVYPRHEAPDVTTILRHADEALYRAKRDGRDRVELWSV